MGKSLIIKDTDFSAVSLGKVVYIEWDDLSSSIVYGKERTQFLHFPQSKYVNQLQFSPDLTTRIVLVDISRYEGGLVKFTHNSYKKSSILGAYWMAFASAITISLELAVDSVNNWATVVEYIDGTLNNGEKSEPITETITIPSGAKYLIFSDKIEQPVAKVRCSKKPIATE